MPDSNVSHLVCETCLASKPVEQFPKRSQRRCKSCINKEQCRAKYRKDIEKSRAKNREYRRKNIDTIRAREKEYKLLRPELKRESNRRYREKNKAKVQAGTKAWAEKNYERKLAVQKVYQEAHREQYKKYRKKAAANYRAKHPEKLKAKYKAWASREDVQARNTARKRRYYEEDPTKALAYNRNRRARKKQASGSHTAKDILEIWECQKHKCAVKGCTHPIAASGKHKYHVDHIVALVNGGSNDPSNLQILCRQHNCEKNAKDDIQWANSLGLLFVK